MFLFVEFRMLFASLDPSEVVTVTCGARPPQNDQETSPPKEKDTARPGPAECVPPAPGWPECYCRCACLAALSSATHPFHRVSPGTGQPRKHLLLSVEVQMNTNDRGPGSLHVPLCGV